MIHVGYTSNSGSSHLADGLPLSDNSNKRYNISSTNCNSSFPPLSTTTSSGSTNHLSLMRVLNGTSDPQAGSSNNSTSLLNKRNFQFRNLSFGASNSLFGTHPTPTSSQQRHSQLSLSNVFNNFDRAGLPSSQINGKSLNLDPNDFPLLETMTGSAATSSLSTSLSNSNTSGHFQLSRQALSSNYLQWMSGQLPGGGNGGGLAPGGSSSSAISLGRGGAASGTFNSAYFDDHSVDSSAAAGNYGNLFQRQTSHPHQHQQPPLSGPEFSLIDCEDFPALPTKNSTNPPASGADTATAVDASRQKPLLRSVPLEGGGESTMHDTRSFLPGSLVDDELALLGQGHNFPNASRLRPLLAANGMGEARFTTTKSVHSRRANGGGLVTPPLTVLSPMESGMRMFMDRTGGGGGGLHRSGSVSRSGSGGGGGLLTDEFGLTALSLMLQQRPFTLPGEDMTGLLVASRRPASSCPLSSSSSSSSLLYVNMQSPLMDLFPCRPQDMDWIVPEEYHIRHRFRAQLANLRISDLTDDTLFWLFFNCCQEDAQAVAAKALHSRGWCYLWKQNLWIANLTPSEQQLYSKQNICVRMRHGQGETSYVSVWDPVENCRCVRRLDFIYADFETPPDMCCDRFQVFHMIYPGNGNAPGGGSAPTSSTSLATSAGINSHHLVSVIGSPVNKAVVSRNPAVVNSNSTAPGNQRWTAAAGGSSTATNALNGLGLDS